MIMFIFYAFLSACLELAFQGYKEELMILRFYHNFLKRLWHSKYFLLKKLSQVMGLCPYCNGFWLSVIIYIAYYHKVSFEIFLFCGLNYVMLKIMILRIVPRGTI